MLYGLPPKVPENSETSGGAVVVTSPSANQPPADSSREHLLPSSFSFFLPGIP